MLKDVIGVLATYAGIVLILTIVKRWIGNRVLTFLGLAMIIQPAVIDTYREMDPWFSLGAAVVGAILLMAGVRRG